VGADLLVPQKFRFGSRGQGRGIPQRHLRGGVPEVALHDMDGNPVVEQFGGVPNECRSVLKNDTRLRLKPDDIV
jgi:hypothetical protein